MIGFIVVVEKEHMEDGYRIEAVVTKGMNGMGVEDRAYDIAYRIQADDSRGGEVMVIPTKLDPSNADLEVLVQLDEVPKDDFVKAAYLELRRSGELQIPLWVNTAWLRHEVRARYDVGVECFGRKMILTRKADEAPQSTIVQTEDEDAGFAETEAF
jgi:hypothetical protein